MTDSKTYLTDIFSRLLIDFKNDDEFRPGNLSKCLTNKGHGPFCVFDDGKTAFDLRFNVHRWPFGHSHPLFIKSVLESLEQSLPNSNPITSNLQEVQSNIPVEKSYNFHFLAGDLFSEVSYLAQTLNITNTNIFYLNEKTFSNKSHLEQKIKQIEKAKNHCIIIEDNLVTYHHTGSPLLERLSFLPTIYITNWGLPNFSIYSKEHINPVESSTNLLTNQIVTKNFLKLLREANILGNNGVIHNREKLLSSAIKKWDHITNISGICFSLNAPNDLWVTLLEKGLLCEYDDGNLFFNFPITLKEDQFNIITGILKEHI